MGHFTRDSTPFADTDVAKAVTSLTIAKFILAAKGIVGNGCLTHYLIRFAQNPKN